MRFAKLGEEVYARQSELAGEELRLYIIIFFHTWVDSRKCNKTLSELCEIYKLDYDNSSRRLKILRQKKWLENTKKHIRPLIGFKTVNSTVEPDKTVNLTVNETDETVNSTVSNCKNYSEIDVETVNSTVSSIPYIEPFKDENSLQTTTTEPEVVDVVGKSNILSKFSFEEIRRYVELCTADGQTVKNPYGLAVTLHKTGEADALISAALYPEQIEFAPQETEHTQYTDEEFYETPAPEPMGETERENMLVIMRGMMRNSTIEGLQSLAWLHTPEDWAWLMEELRHDR